MYYKGQAKLYYLYMMSDGEVSGNEKMLFNLICKELNMGADDQKCVIDDCKEIVKKEKMRCIDVLKKNAEESYVYGIFDLNLCKYDSDKEKATILWNLINLGYADTHFTSEEKEVVKFLKSYFEVSDSIYKEMIHTAETCLSLEKHIKWAEKLPESDYKTEKMKQIKHNLKSVHRMISTTISELDF